MIVSIDADEAYPVYFISKTISKYDTPVSIPDEFLKRLSDHEYEDLYYQTLLMELANGMDFDKADVEAKKDVQERREFDKEFDDE